METLSILFREKNTGKKIMGHFQFTQLECIGVVESADTAGGFRFTELGEELLRTHTHPLEFAEAVRRVGYDKAHSKPPRGYVGALVRKH